MKKRRVRYFTWMGEGTGKPERVTREIARATAGSKLFRRLYDEALEKGYSIGSRVGYYVVIIEADKM